MSDPITLTHPETGEVWTSGKRGRKPGWVIALQNGTPLPERTEAADKPKNGPKVPGALRVWKLVGVAGESGDNDSHQQRGHCLLIGKDKTEAVLTANATFRYHMGGAELSTMWKELDHDMIADLHASGIDVTKTGIYESDGSGWKPRPKLHG